MTKQNSTKVSSLWRTFSLYPFRSVRVVRSNNMKHQGLTLARFEAFSTSSCSAFNQYLDFVNACQNLWIEWPQHLLFLLRPGFVYAHLVFYHKHEVVDSILRNKNTRIAQPEDRISKHGTLQLQAREATNAMDLHAKALDRPLYSVVNNPAGSSWRTWHPECKSVSCNLDNSERQAQHALPWPNDFWI